MQKKNLAGSLDLLNKKNIDNESIRLIVNNVFYIEGFIKWIEVTIL